MRPIHQCSLYSIFLEPIGIVESTGEEVVFGGATGFLFREDEKVFLVSNYHVFSGLNAETNVVLHSTGLVPSKVRAHFLLDDSEMSLDIIECQLLTEDRRMWQEHPSGGMVDVAALEITPPIGHAHFGMDEIVEAPGLGDDFFRVNQEVSVIGFPAGVRVNARLPVWKRSVIASEPFSPLAGNPNRLLIDTASRPGMSGSPVLYVGKNVSPIGFDDRKGLIDFPSVKVALGIYSGRIGGMDEFSAQLGIVWSMDCVKQVVRNRRLNETG
ncbi:hypothetical protein GTP58_20275 [Duganella sp. CY15W]|uniref:trypsin-like peptidase domain-containing protein n=1 Tax=Duganella sp. CY15W TaxID=2692172 RepID=UPI0013691E4A|nr:trypsin-like peptidase domain-containing protein [Duganella sp. CY15W]MYM30673.1 hypothetical protein [Duganella sp. CY15W]